MYIYICTMYIYIHMCMTLRCLRANLRENTVPGEVIMVNSEMESLYIYIHDTRNDFVVPGVYIHIYISKYE